MIEEIDNISEKTVVFVLLRYDSFEQQHMKNLNRETWEINGGYDVKDSPIPAPNNYDVFGYSLKFSDNVPFASQAHAYGFVNALRKGRKFDKPFIIVPASAKLINPIHRSVLNNNSYYFTLGAIKNINNGIIVTPKGANKLSKFFLTRTITDTVHNFITNNFNVLYDINLSAITLDDNHFYITNGT